MRLQDALWNCGPAALSNARLALGLDYIPHDAIAELGGANGTDGMRPSMMQTAIRKLQLRGAVIDEPKTLPHRAWYQLVGGLMMGMPAVIVTDDGEHWCAVVGMLGDRVVLYDSAASVRPSCVTYDRDALLKAWLGEGRYYGISIGRPV